MALTGDNMFTLYCDSKKNFFQHKKTHLNGVSKAILKYIFSSSVTCMIKRVITTRNAERSYRFTKMHQQVFRHSLVAQYSTGSNCLWLLRKASQLFTVSSCGKNTFSFPVIFVSQ